MIDRTGSPFPTTNWTLVAGIESADEGGKKKALEVLCREYWPTLYTFARYQGLSSADAEDVTQGFIASLVRRGVFESVDESKGRLRSFLSVAMRRYISNWRSAGRAQRRGGGHELIELDTAEVEGRISKIDSDTDPEIAFDRAWVAELLNRARARMAKVYAKRGKSELFLRLFEFLTPGDIRGELEAVAIELEVSESALKARLCRMREEFGGEVRAEVMATVGKQGDVEAEVRLLMQVFAG